MPRMRIWVELSEDHLQRLRSEARRRDVTVEQLVEQSVNALIEECEQELVEGIHEEVTFP